MKRLTFSTRASVDLDEIADHIAEDDPERALSYVAELERRALAAAERPFTFPARDDIAPGLRGIPHRSHLILFQVLEDEVLIVRIVHGARELGALWLD